jgi:ribosomal protein L40E
MVKSPPPIDPRHERSQALLRFLGPLVLGLGVVLTAIGLISFFASFRTFEPPRYFWAALIGLPLIGIGAAITRLGYLGAFFRYFSGEVTPVARDTFNTMAEGTQSGVETVARALGRGLSSGMGGNILPEPGTILCRRCEAPNPSHARFCNQCGTALQGSTCTECGAAMVPGAQFCNQCGKPVA